MTTKTIGLDRSEEDSALLGLAQLRESVDEAHSYSTRSRNTSISPPHGSPTSHAMSSVMP